MQAWSPLVNFAEHDNRETDPGLPFFTVLWIYTNRENKPWFTRCRQGQTLAFDIL